jgi:hypothetical protein
LSVKCYPWLLNSWLGFSGTFYLYSLVALMAGAWGAATIQASDGLSLVQVENLYQSKTKKKSTQENNV